MEIIKKYRENFQATLNEDQGLVLKKLINSQNNKDLILKSIQDISNLEQEIKENVLEKDPTLSLEEDSKKAQSEKPDVIILDQLMPGIYGLDVCKALKDNEVTKRIPVLFFTAFTSFGFEESCIEAGAVGIFYKPTISELVDYMKRILHGEKMQWGNEE